MPKGYIWYSIDQLTTTDTFNNLAHSTDFGATIFVGPVNRERAYTARAWLGTLRAWIGF